jgi:hypothetical protein
MPMCRLCLQDKPLVKAHIVPRFMYQELFDKNKMLVQFEPHKALDSPNYRPRKIPAGEYDPDILCRDCDGGIIGKDYEDYARKVLYGGKLLLKDHVEVENLLSIEGATITQLRNIDYRKYKLFLLSILWRASISSREFSQHVSLGPHEEVIRRMLIDGAPGPETQYPILFYTYRNDANAPIHFIGPPMPSKTEGFRAYIFPISGVIYSFFIGSSSHSPPKDVVDYSIREDNSLRILHAPEGRGMSIINSIYGIDSRGR